VFLNCIFLNLLVQFPVCLHVLLMFFALLNNSAKQLKLRDPSGDFLLLLPLLFFFFWLAPLFFIESLAFSPMGFVSGEVDDGVSPSLMQAGTATRVLIESNIPTASGNLFTHPSSSTTPSSPVRLVALLL